MYFLLLPRYLNTIIFVFIAFNIIFPFLHASWIFPVSCHLLLGDGVFCYLNPVSTLSILTSAFNGPHSKTHQNLSLAACSYTQFVTSTVFNKYYQSMLLGIFTIKLRQPKSYLQKGRQIFTLTDCHTTNATIFLCLVE